MTAPPAMGECAEGIRTLFELLLVAKPGEDYNIISCLNFMVENIGLAYPYFVASVGPDP